MLLTLTTTHSPATDLGHLLGKNPARLQHFALAFGSAWVFYPDVADDLCTVALVVDVDPVALTRRRQGPALAPWVNDRPYVASSFTSVAIAQVFRSALQGTSKDRPELALTPLPLVARLAVVACTEGVARLCFEPLGYVVEVEAVVAREGDSGDGGEVAGETRPALLQLTLRHTVRLADLLSHLYVLLPVLDDDKHYYVGKEELEKLLDHGSTWLAAHPAKDLITRRYLKHLRFLSNEALERLTAGEDVVDDDAAAAAEAGLEGVISADTTAEASVESSTATSLVLSLNDRRLDQVADLLEERRVSRVIDLGCGEGKLLRRLLKQSSIVEVVGVDVSTRALAMAADRLRIDEMPAKKRARLRLFQGSLFYRDARFRGFDAAVAVEVIEHLPLSRLPTFERVLFGDAAPPLVIITTPNVEYNVRYNLAVDSFRHSDHRFEWSRAEFAAWAGRTAEVFGYDVEFVAVGDVDDEVGPPTQMAVFTRRSPA